MNEKCESGTYRFPELDGVDLWHLWQTFKYQGRDGAISWLRANVAVELRHQFEEDFDEDAYYEAALDQYVDTGTELSEKADEVDE